MKICIHCRKSKKLEDYHNNKATPDGKLSVCKPCRKVQQQKYRDSGRGLLRDKRYRDSGKHKIGVYRYIELHPLRKQCQSKLSNALRNGKIVNTNCCEVCNSGTNVQGHHWKYSVETELDVFWLCKKCHTKEHEIIKVLGYPKEKVLYLSIKVR